MLSTPVLDCKVFVMRKRKDYVGQRFNSLTIIGSPYRSLKNGVKYVKCKCKCGTVKDINLYSLMSGSPKSCGCLLRKNEIGSVFGKWTIIGNLDDRIGPNGKPYRYYKCRCDCGKEKTISHSSIIYGGTKSCGCSKGRHGMYKTKIYNVWQNMRRRCDNSNNPYYKNYGGRGITYDKKRNTFEGFYEDMKHGYKEGLTIDRIDNDGNYSKENCRRATHKQQCNNKRTNHLIIYKGQTHNIKQWSEVLSIPYNTLIARICKYGWDIDRALTEKIN